MAIEGVSISYYKHSVTDNGNGTSTVKYNLNEHWVYKDGAFTDEQPLTQSGTKTVTGMYAQGVTVSDYYLKNGRSYSADSGTTIDKMFLVSYLVNDYITKYTISSSCIVSDIITTHSNASLEMQVMITFYDSSGKSISTLRGYSGEINAFSGSKTLTATKEITIPSNAYYFQPCVGVFFYPKVDGATTVADTFTYMGGDFLIETVQPTSSLPEDTPEQPTTPTRKFTRLYIGGAVASSGTRVFRKLTTEEPTEALSAGLYDANGDLLADWDTLVNTYGMDVEKDYAYSDSNTDAASPYCVLTNNSELSTGTKLVVSDSVESIGDYAFRNCNMLTDLDVGNGATQLGYNIVSDCGNLINMTLGSGVSAIRSYMSCPNLAGIWVSSNNQTYSSDEKGVLFDKDKTVLKVAPKAISGVYSIPNTVTCITESAFYNCIHLTEAIIDGTSLAIGSSAFMGCRGLTNITIKNGVVSIEYNAFRECTALASVVIPDSVIEVGGYAFYRCTALTSVVIGSGITKIDAKMLAGCTALTNVSIGANVTRIGESAFSGCSKLTRIIIPSGATHIYRYAFTDCTGLTDIVIPDTVTFVSSGVFTRCSKLRYNWSGGARYLGNANNPYHILASQSDVSIANLNINEHTRVIAEYSCWQSTTLKSVVIPDNITSIPASAFSLCSNLASVTFGNGIIDIGESAFNACAKLTSVVLGNNVAHILSYAFSGCTGITSITIPASVTNIEGYAFSGCTGLTDVYYRGTEEQWEVINVGTRNDQLVNATIHYNYTG